MINNKGISININQFINDNYNCISRKYVKLCDKTNFNTGYIAYDDLVFLPNGTYIKFKNNNIDLYGKIFHFNWDFPNKHAIKNGTAIVHLDYDINSSNKYYDLDDNKIYFKIEKNIYVDRNSTMEYAQIIDILPDKIEEMHPVKVIYGMPNVKQFCRYGYMDDNGNIYEKNSCNSKIIIIPTCYKEIHNISIDELLYHKTDKEYCIKNESNVVFAPGQAFYFCVSIIIMIVSFIFKWWYIIWILTIIWYLYNISKIRKDYHLNHNDSEWENEEK